MRKGLYWAVILLLIVQCKSSQAPSEGSLMMEMRRTACFGTCPDYEIKIYSDGRISYQGNRHVPLEGSHQLKLNKDDLNEIISAMNSTDFFSMEDEYHKDVTDLPTTYLTIYKEDQVKKIMDYYGAPEELRTFEDLVQEIVFRNLN